MQQQYHLHQSWLWLLLLPLLCLSSCSGAEDVLEIDDSNTSSSKTPIIFSATDDWSDLAKTRATNTSSFKQGDEIGVYAYHLPSNTWGNDVQEFMVNQKVEYNGSTWTYSPIKYWPQVGNITFYSFYPLENSQISDSNVPIIKWSNIGNMDIMWAKYENGTSSTPINLPFQHKLMKIKLKLMKGDGYGENTELLRCNILGGDDTNKLAKEASLNLKTGEITFDTNNTYTINILGEKTALSIPDMGYEHCLYINPLRKIRIALSTSNMDYPDISVVLPDGGTNKFYTISITIHGTNISVNVNHLWTDNTIDDQIIE